MTRFTVNLTLLVLCIIAILWVWNRGPAKLPSVPQAPEIPSSSTNEQVERETFFKSNVEPSISAADKLNNEAAERCIRRLKDSFDGYQTGIGPFCKDVNSWGTRLGVISRMPGDWWNEKTEVATYVQEKFGKHLFTDKKLKEDIQGALAQFRFDVNANQNELVISIRAAISSRDLPTLPDLDFSQFASDLTSTLGAYSAETARNSVVNLLVTEIASGVGGMVAEQLLAQLITRLSTMAAASTATAGGATAGGAAAGGGTGALGGPIGVAAGFVVGLAVGGVIDSWMSSKFEARMTAQLNQLVDELSKQVITGDSNHPGLSQALQETCELLERAYAESLRSRIVDGVRT